MRFRDVPAADRSFPELFSLAVSGRWIGLIAASLFVCLKATTVAAGTFVVATDIEESESYEASDVCGEVTEEARALATEQNLFSRPLSELVSLLGDRDCRLANAALVALRDFSPEQSVIEALIRGLGSPNYRVRAFSRTELIAMGRQVLRHLVRSRNDTDPEIRESVRQLIPVAMVQPTRVTFGSSNARAAISTFAAQTGFTIVIESFDDMELTEEFVRRPFLEALDAVCRATGSYFTKDISGTLTIRAGAEQRPGPLAYYGPLRVKSAGGIIDRLLSLPPIDNPNAERTWNYFQRFYFEILTEPGVELFVTPEMRQGFPTLGINGPEQQSGGIVFRDQITAQGPNLPAAPQTSYPLIGLSFRLGFRLSLGGAEAIETDQRIMGLRFRNVTIDPLPEPANPNGGGSDEEDKTEMQEEIEPSAEVETAVDLDAEIVNEAATNGYEESEAFTDPLGDTAQSGPSGSEVSSAAGLEPDEWAAATWPENASMVVTEEQVGRDGAAASIVSGWEDADIEDGDTWAGSIDYSPPDAPGCPLQEESL